MDSKRLKRITKAANNTYLESFFGFLSEVVAIISDLISKLRYQTKFFGSREVTHIISNLYALLNEIKSTLIEPPADEEVAVDRDEDPEILSPLIQG
jgi:hypothetical protein